MSEHTPDNHQKKPQEQEAVPQPAGGRSDDDEISLVDLLAVLIRYRRLVIGLPLLVGLLGALYFWALPAVGLLQGRAASYEGSIELPVADLSNELLDAAGFNIESRAGSVLGNAAVVGELYGELHPEARAERSADRYHAMIRDRLIDGDRLNYEYDESAGVLSITYRGDDADNTAALLTALAERVRNELQEPLADSLHAAEARIERALVSAEDRLTTVFVRTASAVAPAGDGGLNEEAVRRLAGTARAEIDLLYDQAVLLAELQIFLDADTAALGEPGEPVVAQADGGGLSVRLVVAVFAAGFFAVFLAFVLEFARNVAADPVESGKLRKAWRRE